MRDFGVFISAIALFQCLAHLRPRFSLSFLPLDLPIQCRLHWCHLQPLETRIRALLVVSRTTVIRSCPLQLNWWSVGAYFNLTGQASHTFPGIRALASQPYSRCNAGGISESRYAAVARGMVFQICPKVCSMVAYIVDQLLIPQFSSQKSWVYIQHLVDPPIYTSYHPCDFQELEAKQAAKKKLPFIRMNILPVSPTSLSKLFGSPEQSNMQTFIPTPPSSPPSQANIQPPLPVAISVPYPDQLKSYLSVADGQGTPRLQESRQVFADSLPSPPVSPPMPNTTWEGRGGTSSTDPIIQRSTRLFEELQMPSPPISQISMFDDRSATAHQSSSPVDLPTPTSPTAPFVPTKVAPLNLKSRRTQSITQTPPMSPTFSTHMDPSRASPISEKAPVVHLQRRTTTGRPLPATPPPRLQTSDSPVSTIEVNNSLLCKRLS